MRPTQWHLKNNWRVPETLEKSYPHSRVTPTTFAMVAGGRQHTHRSTITSTKTCSADALKKERGAHLNEHTARGDWSLPESKLHINYLELKAVFLAPKDFQDLFKPYSPHSYRQHNSGCLHKQGRRDEVRPLLCPLVENTDLVYQETGYFQGPTHPRLAERDSRQAI